MTGAVDQTERMTTGAAESAPERMKVFVSYSRDDVTFADQLVAGLEHSGFDPILDRHDIDAAENWRNRLGALIHSSDAVVFVLTDRSAASPICEWEVTEAKQLGKRIVPIAPRDVSAKPPEALADLNWIHFYATPAIPGSGMLDGMRKLDRALRVDLAWLREQTRLSEQATLWKSRTARQDDATAASLLLRGAALEEAHTWARATPAGASVPAIVADYLDASTTAEAVLNAEAAAQLTQREAALAQAVTANHRARVATWIGAGVAAALLIVAAAAGWTAMNGLSLAEKQTAALEQSVSNSLAREAAAIQAKLDPAKALLMALHADPAARSDPAERKLRGEDGHALARAQLVAAYQANHLTMALGQLRGEVTEIAYSGDGRRVAASSFYGDLKVFDTQTGKELLSIRDDENDTRTRGILLAISPTGDHVIRRGPDDVTRVIDVDTGKEVRIIDTAGGSQIYAAAYSPDGKLIATDPGSAIHLWSRATGELVKSVDTACHSFRMSFSSDSATLLVPESYKACKVDVATGALNSVDLGRPFTSTFSIYSPSGNMIAITNFSEPGARLYDTVAMKATDMFYGALVYAVAFSSDQKFLVAAADDGIHLSNLANEFPLETIATDQRMRSVAVDPRGRFVATGDEHGSVRIWDLEYPRYFVRESPAREVARRQQFSPDGKLTIERGETKESRIGRLIDVATGKILQTLKGHEDRVYYWAFSGDGKRVVTSAADNSARVWDVATGALVIALKQDAQVSTAALSHDGQRIATESNDTVKVWDVSTGRELYSLPGYANQIGFSTNGERIVTLDGNAHVWDAATGRPLSSLPRENDADIQHVSLSPDGLFVATTNQYDLRISLWDAASGVKLTSFGSGAYADFTSDGRQIVSNYGDPKEPVKVWALPSIVFAPPQEQVRLACEQLIKSRAPTAFTREDVSRYPLLADQPQSPDGATLISPCAAYIPD